MPSEMVGRMGALADMIKAQLFYYVVEAVYGGEDQ